MPGEYVFGRGSNVLEHWLVNAEGFVVRSGRSNVGVVRRVVVDPARGRASALVLRSPYLHRQRIVLAREVEAVDPAVRQLVLAPPTPRPSRLETLRRWSDELDRHADRAGAWLRPRLERRVLAACVFVRRYARELAVDVHDRYAQSRARSRVRDRTRRRSRAGA